MQFNLDQDENLNLIRSYADGSVRLRDQTLSENFIITTTQTIPWSATSCLDLLEEHMDQILSLGPEVVLLGSGPKLVFPPHNMMVLALSRGVGFETMDTAAACRTFNILAMEGRNVVAALLL